MRRLAVVAAIFMALVSTAVSSQADPQALSGHAAGEDKWLAALHALPPGAVQARPLALSAIVTSTCESVNASTVSCTSVDATAWWLRADGTTAHTHDQPLPLPLSAAKFVIPGREATGSVFSYWLVFEQSRYTCTESGCAPTETASVRLPAEGTFEIALTRIG